MPFEVNGRRRTHWMPFGPRMEGSITEAHFSGAGDDPCADLDDDDLDACADELGLEDDDELDQDLDELESEADDELDDELDQDLDELDEDLE
jgi:hypothetical protein